MTLPAAIERIRPAIVQIRVAGEDAVLGTGFFVDEDGPNVVTAKHVLDAGRRAVGAADVTFTVGMAAPNADDVGGANVALRGLFTLLPAHVVAEDGANDLGVLRVTLQNPCRGELPALVAVDGGEGRSEVAVAPLSVVRPVEGVTVASSGYPLANSVLITNTGVVASAWATAPDAADLGVGIAIFEPVDRYVIDLEVNPGHSGGPVYLAEDGSVIGVCVATQTAPVTRGGEPFAVAGVRLGYSSGLTIAIPSRYVTALIDRL